MVFKPFSHLARRSTKAFTHGYAQSLAAASQSSYASTQTPLGQFNHHRIGKTSTQPKGKSHNSAIHNAVPKSNVLSARAEEHHEAGLETYLSAWQKYQNGEEWQQYPSSKRVGWKSSAGLPARLLEKDVQSGNLRPNAPTERAYSANDAEDIKKADEADEIALQQVNEAIAQEISEINESSKQLAENVESAATAKAEDEAAVALEDTVIQNTVDLELAAHVNHIAFLEKSGKYAEIPATFAHMLRNGLVPPTKTYNALIMAAIRLSNSASQVVPKALDIYSDMLRRKTSPDDVTYTLLLELLSLRALEIIETKSVLDDSRTRFQPVKGDRTFLLQSRDTEQAIVEEDDSFNVAIKLFNLSVEQSSNFVFPATTYRLLLEACAKRGDVDQMIRIYSHMESNKVTPLAASYPPMIQAFAKSGDLGSAVECYNEYKALAISDDNGNMSLLSRADEDVYAALVRSYLICDRSEGAEKFIERIFETLQDPKAQETFQKVRDTVLIDGLLQQTLAKGNLEAALEISQRSSISEEGRIAAYAKLATTAADSNNAEIASKAYNEVLSHDMVRKPATAMLAMYIRQGNILFARNVWALLLSMPSLGLEMVEPTLAYSLALVSNGFVDEALVQARLSFNRLRSSLVKPSEVKEAAEMIDESIDLIGRHLAESGTIPSAHGIMSLMWTMVENGGLLTPVVEQLLAGLGPDGINKLSLQDLKLAAQVEAGIVEKADSTLDLAHFARFAHILETIISHRMPVDERTVDLIDAALAKVGPRVPELVMFWNNHVRPQQFEPYQQPTAHAAPAPTYYEPFDPYANTLDQKGSAIIVDELEKQGSSSATSLHEALARFRNIRRAGRHPRYIAYAKLIAAASKEGRPNLMNEIFEMAKRDMPLLPQYPVVKHGWTTILDSMVGACLTMGNRALAAEYHRQLLEIGSAPSANTFGLYITTLKESTKTFDEATEAVKIFLRAKSEGVEPTSFLYNALIGKLGKARRIDDCLFYFAEMRALGIRPTSVTYGTVVNALCRVSDERFAEELFDEMESMPNYKPRPAPYNSMMQFFLTTKRDSSKVLEYYKRMQARNIQPTMHTYKLLIDTYATLEPINLAAAESVFDSIRASGQRPEGVHYASLIHARGCVLHDMQGAKEIFDKIINDPKIQAQACLYQALFESMVANHAVQDTDSLLGDMAKRHVEMTPYIANTLIHGWAIERNIEKAKSAYEHVSKEKREPSTYEAMTRAFLVVGDRQGAAEVVNEMLSRGYPSAVAGKVLELLGHGSDSVTAPPATLS
jgi:pentatricopeptide repeat protein